MCTPVKCEQNEISFWVFLHILCIIFWRPAIAVFSMYEKIISGLIFLRVFVFFVILHHFLVLTLIDTTNEQVNSSTTIGTQKFKADQHQLYYTA